MRLKEMSGSGLLRAQTAVCVLLIAVMLAVSFASLYTVKVETPKVMQDAIDSIVEILNDPMISDGEKIEFELPEKLSVNLLLFIRFGSRINDVVEIYNSMLELAKVQNATTTNEYYQAYNRLRLVAAEMKELVKSDEFIDAIALACAIVSGFSQSTATGFVMIIMMVMTAILPVILLITLLRALITRLVCRKNAERAYMKVIKSFKSAAVVFIIVMALGLFDNNAAMSVGLIVGLCACVAGYLFAAIASRFKRYTELGRQYLNTVQLTSFIKLAAFIGYFLCVAKSGIIGQYAAIVSKSAMSNIKAQTYGTEFLSQYMFMLLALIGVVALVCTLSILPFTLFRMGGMLGRNKETAMFSTIASIFIIIVPVYVSLEDWRIIIDTNAKVMLIVAVVCWLLMISCEIGLVMWRKTFMTGLRETEKYAVLRGLEDVETEWFDAPED